MAGRSEKAVSPLEADVRLGSRQSVTAVRALPAGHRLVPGDLTIKRPGTGLSPARLATVLGRELARPVAADALLHEEDLLPPTVRGVATAPAPTEARGPAVEV
jgi:sialic acid synthase SpsE